MMGYLNSSKEASALGAKEVERGKDMENRVRQVAGAQITNSLKYHGNFFSHILHIINDNSMIIIPFLSTLLSQMCLEVFLSFISSLPFFFLPPSLLLSLPPFLSFFFPFSFSSFFQFPPVKLDVETECDHQILPELATVLTAFRVINDIASHCWNEIDEFKYHKHHIDRRTCRHILGITFSIFSFNAKSQTDGHSTST